MHLHAGHMHGILAHRAGHGDVMALVSLQGILVVDGKHFLVAIGDDDHLLASSHAFLGAGLSTGVRALGAALGIAHPSVDGCALAHVVESQRGQSEDKTYCQTNR